MLRRPPRSTLFPTRRSSDLSPLGRGGGVPLPGWGFPPPPGGGPQPSSSPYGTTTTRGWLSLRESNPALRVFYRIFRSEEHTSELQSPVHLVCRLLLEKKKKQ